MNVVRDLASAAFGRHEIPRWPFAAMSAFGVMCVIPKTVMFLNDRKAR